MKKKSRLKNISQEQYKKNILLIFAGIIVLFCFFVLFGVPLLVQTTLLVQNLRSSDIDISNDESEFLVPPVLDPLPNATNKGQINISGSALPNQNVKLYVNGKYFQQKAVNDKGVFVFRKITLKKAENIIRAKTVGSNNKESDYSESLKIIYKNTPPNLEIVFPSDKQVITGRNQVKVEGKTDIGSQVMVNDYWAIGDNEGNFSYLLNLQNGENKIKVVSTDEAGNNTTKEISITLNP